MLRIVVEHYWGVKGLLNGDQQAEFGEVVRSALSHGRSDRKHKNGGSSCRDRRQEKEGKEQSVKDADSSPSPK